MRPISALRAAYGGCAPKWHLRVLKTPGDSSGAGDAKLARNIVHFGMQ